MKRSIPEWLVRPATEADAPALAELMGELGYPAAATAIPARVRALGTDRRAMIVVAADPQALGGVITAHHLDSIHDDRPVGWITTLVVSQRVRGQGVGRLLVEAAERWASEHHCVRVSVTTALHRAGAHAFYERLGYTQSGRRYTKALG